MSQPAEAYHLTQEDQDRMLARVYAFILSDEFTGAPVVVPDKKPRRKKPAQTHGESQDLDAAESNKEPLA
jgi:hypothetical protein